MLIVGCVVGFTNGIDFIDPNKYPKLTFYVFITLLVFNFTGIPDKLREWAGLKEPEKESN